MHGTVSKKCSYESAVCTSISVSILFSPLVRCTLSDVKYCLHAPGQMWKISDVMFNRFQLISSHFMSNPRTQCKNFRATAMDTSVQLPLVISLAKNAILDKRNGHYESKLKLFYESQLCSPCSTFYFRFLPNMEQISYAVNENESEDVIEMDVKQDLMSDGEIQTELVILQKDRGDELNNTIIECPVAMKTTLATPKVKSVVVIPEKSNRSGDPNSNPNPTSTASFKTEKKANSNRNGSVKRSTRKKVVEAGAGSLVSMLSKVTVSKPDAEVKTPTITKRIRSAETTPESQQSQPVKTQTRNPTAWSCVEL